MPNKTQKKVAIVTPIYSEYQHDDGGYYIRDNDGFKMAECASGKKADCIVKAVNACTGMADPEKEIAAFRAVAEAASEMQKVFTCDSIVTDDANSKVLFALSALSAIQKEGK